MAKVIVIGAFGFIGKSLVENLLKDNYKVVAVTRNVNNDAIMSLKQLYSKNFEVVECEMSNYIALSDKIKSCDIDAAVYLSWDGNSGVNRSKYEIQIKNIKGLLDCITSLKLLKCKKIIATGTISELLIQKDNANITSQNMMYAAAKAAAYKMADIECSNSEIDFTWLRLGNIYGKGNETGNLMSYTISSLLKEEKPSYSSATVLQDFVFIEDCVMAIKLAITKTLQKNIYYIGTGNPRELKEFLLEVRDIINPNLALGIGEREDDGTFYEEKWFDISDFYAETNYKPCFTFKQGIELTLNKE